MKILGMFLLAMLSGTAIADEAVLGTSIGRYYGMIDAARPVLELQRGTAGGLWLYAGASFGVSPKMAVSLGAAYETRQTHPLEGEYGMTDPRSPAMQVQYQAARDHISSVGGGGLRIGGSLADWRPQGRVRHYLDRHQQAWIQLETKRGLNGERQGWYSFQLKF